MKPKTKTDNSTGTHSKYSPSGLAMFATCPGYVAAQDQQDEEEVEDEFSPSSIGTRIHAALEAGDPRSLLSAHELSIYDSAQKMLDDAWTEFTMKTEIERAYQEFLSEHKFRGIVFDPAEEAQTGTADVLIRANCFSLIADYKTGINAVTHPKDNAQFISYGLLEMEENPDCEAVVLVLIQPTVADGFKMAVMYRNEKAPRLDYAERVEGDFKYNLNRVASIILSHKANRDNPYAYHASPFTCAYCTKSNKCSRIFELARTLGKRTLDADVLTVNPVNEVMDGFDSPETVSQVLDFCFIMEKVQARVKEIAKTMFSAGVEVPGYKFASRGTTVHVNASQFREYILSRMSLEEIVGSLTTFPASKLLKFVMARETEGMSQEEEEEFRLGFLEDLEDMGVIKEVKARVALLKK